MIFMQVNLLSEYNCCSVINQRPYRTCEMCFEWTLTDVRRKTAKHIELEHMLQDRLHCTVYTVFSWRINAEKSLEISLTVCLSPFSLFCYQSARMLERIITWHYQTSVSIFTSSSISSSSLFMFVC